MTVARKKTRNRNESELVAMLARKYPAPAFALLSQLRSGTGFVEARTADAAVFSLWPSRGLELYGFECKSSRTDWLKELADPKKAAKIQRYCHRWWIVCGGSDIVQPGELPANWGLMVVSKNGQGLSVKVAAPELKPEPPNLSLVCAIMRRVTDNNVPRVKHNEIVKRVEKESFQKGQDSAGPAGEAEYRENFLELRGYVDRFEKQSGIDLDDWDWERLANAVKLCTSPSYHRSAVDLLRSQVAGLDEVLREHRERLEGLIEAEGSLKGVKHGDHIP